MNTGRVSILTMLLGALILLGHPTASSAQTVLYDDFNTGVIDPAKWSGFAGGGGGPATEVARLIESGALRMQITQYGRSDTDAGSSFGANNLNVMNPVPITALQAIVTVTNAKAQACATNVGLGNTAAGLLGVFFNDGTSTGPSDQTGNITAHLHQVRDALAGFVFRAFLIRCTDTTCSNQETVIGTQFNSTWALGQSRKLRLTWDAANDQFIFLASPETVILPYVLNDSAPPVAQNFKTLSVDAIPANCNGGPEALLSRGTLRRRQGEPLVPGYRITIWHR